MTDEKISELLIREFREAAEGTIQEWCRRWYEGGDGFAVTYYEDGTAEIERETDIGFDRVRIRFAVAVIDATKPNKPQGFVLTRPWSLVPAGWFIQIPSGAWYEVMSTKLEDGKQIVTLRDPETDKRGTFPRDPDAEVKAKRGSKTQELSDAIEALSDVFQGTAVISDEPPWDE